MSRPDGTMLFLKTFGFHILAFVLYSIPILISFINGGMDSNGFLQAGVFLFLHLVVGIILMIRAFRHKQPTAAAAHITYVVLMLLVLTPAALYLLIFLGGAYRA